MANLGSVLQFCLDGTRPAPNMNLRLGEEKM
jgi:hypothetical protein